MGVPVLILLNILICSLAQVSADQIVQLPLGKIRGYTMRSYNGSEYYAYQDIPYAAPPVGQNRFRPPKTPDPWDGILDTNQNKKICIQTVYNVADLSDAIESEDCLYLSVYTPVSPDEANQNSLPVLVYIHGGGYVSGNGYIDGKYFIDHGIVVVGLNYRLGTLGFLTTLDKNIPGNLGLKDQHFAIKWVADNIHLFGGDPKKITITGGSAGAGSVGFQVLSKKNEGLLNGAIQESGAPVCTWNYQAYPKTYAFNVGRILDNSFNSEDSGQLLNLLLKAPAEDIINAARYVNAIESNSGVIIMGDFAWAPVIENADDEDAFITAPMHNAYMVGDFNRVPSLLGFNSEETLAMFQGTSDIIGEAQYADSDASLLISTKLNIASENRSIAGTKLKNLYTSNSFQNDLAAFVQFSSESSFTRCIIHQAETTASFVPVYLYEFAYQDQEEREIPLPIPGIEKVGHSAELKYLYYDYDFSSSQEDALKRLQMVEMWANFVKFQNPTPEKSALLQNIEWPKVESGSNISYLVIGSDLNVVSNPRRYEQVKNVLYEFVQPPYIVF